MIYQEPFGCVQRLNGIHIESTCAYIDTFGPIDILQCLSFALSYKLHFFQMLMHKHGFVRAESRDLIELFSCYKIHHLSK